MKSLNEKLQERRDELTKAERIYEPKYGGKDHSGYDTLMKYEVNYEREECFAKGFDAALTALAELDKPEENLKWLVDYAIERAIISKAKGAELLGIPLIDYVAKPDLLPAFDGEPTEIQKLLSEVRKFCHTVIAKCPPKSDCAAEAFSLGHHPWILNPHLFNAQDAAALSAMKSELEVFKETLTYQMQCKEKLRAEKANEWKKMDEAKDAFAVHTTELENELEKLRAENAILREGLTKVGYVLQSTDSTKMYAREVLTAAEKVSVK